MFKAEHEAYLKQNPQLLQLICDYLADVLLHKPENVRAHAHEYFSTFLPTAPLDSQKKPRILVICGPSGVGKGSLIHKLMKEYPGVFGFSVSHTTRAPRPGEKDGQDYHFVPRAEMEKLIEENGFVEKAEVHGNFYGTSIRAVEDVQGQGKIPILDIDVQGVRQVRRSDVEALYIFVAPPSQDELTKRLTGRGTESAEVIAKRVANSTAEIEASSEPGLFDHVIVNDRLDTAFAELVALLHQDLKLAAKQDQEQEK